MNFQMLVGEIEENKIPKVLEQWNIQFKNLQTKKHAKHIFTHVEWDMIAYEIEIKNKNEQWIWTTKKEMDRQYPLPTAFKKLLN